MNTVDRQRLVLAGRILDMVAEASDNGVELDVKITMPVSSNGSLDIPRRYMSRKERTAR